MKRERDLTRRVRSLEVLGEAVSAMKSLSAHHFRQCRAEVEPARIYRSGIERLAGIAGAALAGGDGPAGLLAIGSQLGLCGGYNARVAALAAQQRAELGDGPTICVGQRAAALLARHGVAIAITHAGPTSVGGLPELLLSLAGDLLRRRARERWSSLDVVSTRFEGVGASDPALTRVFPFAVTAVPDGAAIRYAARDHFAAAAVRELLYVTLHDLLLGALTSEHSSRLVATQAAEQWLDDQIARLRRQLTAARREATTQEVIEIATGGRAAGNASRGLEPRLGEGANP